MLNTLTRREQQVAEAVARGLTNRQIASELGISPETVKRHLATIFDKLGLRRRVVLALYMLRAQHSGDVPMPTLTGVSSSVDLREPRRYTTL